MKKYFLLLIAILLIAPAFASPEAEFKKIGKEYTFYPDGSQDIRCYKELTIKSHVALNRLYGETFVIYNPKFQSVKINSSYTRQADGSIVKTPENAFNEVLPGSAANAPAYNHLRELVITHTGLEIGATIYLDYTLHTKNGYFPQGMKPETDDKLQEESPVKEYVVKINVPASLPMNYILTGRNEKPQVTEKDGLKQYSWAFKNIQPASHEPNIPDKNVPRLTTCSYESQAAALNTLSNIFSDHSNDLIKNTVEKIVKGKEKELDKIMAIQKYVANDIALCGLDFELAGFSARPPDAVIQTAYGTAMEKSALLASMLRAIGQKPEMTVVYPSVLKKGIKGIMPASGVLLKAEANGNPLFLSALSYPTPQIGLGSEKKDIWMISGTETLPLGILENPSSIDYKATIQLKPEKASVEGKLSIKGGLIPFMDEPSTENHLKNLAAGAGKTISTKINSNDFRNASLDFQAEKELSLEQDYLFYTLPAVKSGVSNWNMYMLNSSRENNFELPYPITEKYVYEIVTSPEIAFRAEAKEIKMDKPCGKLRIAVSQNGNILHIEKEISLGKTQLSPGEYADFRKMLNVWNDPNNSTVILKKGK